MRRLAILALGLLLGPANAQLTMTGVGGGGFGAAAGGGANQTLFSAGSTPAASTNDHVPIQIGIRFHATVNGHIKGVRVYKPATATSPSRAVYLWNNATGAQLATATTSGETASGWQEADFATPVAITAGTVYAASATPADYEYAYTDGYSFPVTSGNLVSEATNDWYFYGTVATNPPTNSSQSNYWVDVVFTTP